jgi:glycosyltransferase involved in cell wall biosynthesis
MMTPEKPPFLLIEACDFVEVPAGGQLSFAKSLAHSCPDDFRLVGVAREGEPVGEWITRRIGERELPFYAFDHATHYRAKGWLPMRLRSTISLARHIGRLRACGARGVFLQAPELLFAIRSGSFQSLCMCFAGAENPLLYSRYRIGRWLAPVFMRLLRWQIRKADVVLASADSAACKSLGDRIGRGIKALPTSFDETVFFPHDEQRTVRHELGVAQDEPMFVAVGRISTVKGWRLLLEAFSSYRAVTARGRLVFVGDGEDRVALEAAAAEIGVAEHVSITGMRTPAQVRMIVSAATAVLFGSHIEGFSVAMLEALGCGANIVCTEVSGARDLVRDGRNGFVLENRDPVAFGERMRQSESFPRPNPVSLDIAVTYTTARLRTRLADVWPPFALDVQRG